MAKSMRVGATLIELLIVLMIISLLLQLVLPSVESARESARRAQCQSHLRQLGLAVHLHHDAQGHFPTNGWGYQWAGDPDGGFSESQPGGWAYNVLDYLEAGHVRQIGRGLSGEAKMERVSEALRIPLPVLYCPSRREAKSFPYTEDLFPLRNASILREASKTDFAICAGDEIVIGGAGPAGVEDLELEDYEWPEVEKATGISFVRSQIRFSNIVDGTSHTLMIAEKHIQTNIERTGRHYDNVSSGDDQTAFLGDDADIRRWTVATPLRDQPEAAEFQIDRFGSSHPESCNAVFADGSVSAVSFDVDEIVFKRMGNRADEQIHAATP